MHISSNARFDEIREAASILFAASDELSVLGLEPSIQITPHGLA